MYAEHAVPLTKLLQVGREDGKKGSKKALAWTPESEKAFDDMKAALLKPLSLHLLNPDKGLVLRTDASDYAVGAFLEQVRGKKRAPCPSGVLESCPGRRSATDMDTA